VLFFSVILHFTAIDSFNTATRWLTYSYCSAFDVTWKIVTE